ncbi:MAG: hypothetical protein ACRDPF_35760 [Streptosporangiaceae bacterium]
MPAAPDPDLVSEQDHLTASRTALSRMRERTASLDTSAAGDWVSQKYLASALYLRMKALADDPAVPLFFGRLDYRDSAGSTTGSPGERFYIGRRHVSDEVGDPMVVDWRARVSLPFYRASKTEPMEVRLRRRFGFSHGTLTAYEDEQLLEAQPSGAQPSEAAGADYSAILEAEIERPRVGPMRDIVATIQPEQDVIVRSDLAESVCVQGAPGTGKTAVGLHRAAYLLYAHRDQLADGGLGDVELAERGQDVADVGEEGLVRPDHDHAAPPDLLAVRVQQVRDPVQPDRGLPGAGCALHADGLRCVGAHDIVLVGLDGRDDVPHGPRPRPLDLVDQDPARPGGRDGGRTVRGAVLGPGEQLVLVGGQLAAGEPEAPPPCQVHRVGHAGPVERPRHRRPPVDDRGRAVRRVHVPAADVEAVPGDAVISGLFGVVEAAEEQGGVGDVLEGFGPVVQLRLEVLLGDRVAAHRVQRQHVLAHEVEELA